MIAHRLQTIMTADNLLYLEQPTSVLAASKGTPEYEEIMNRLRKTNYAHQQEDEENEDDDEETKAKKALQRRLKSQGSLVS